MDKGLSCSLRVSNLFLLLLPLSTDSDTVLDSLRQASDELQALEVTCVNKSAMYLFVQKQT